MSASAATATLIFIALAGMTGCNPTYIDYDYDEGADFSQYKSFMWKEQATMTEGTPQAVQVSGLLEARIKRAVSDGLAGRGLAPADTNPDLVVVYHVGIKDITEIRNTGSGWGWDRHTRVDQFQEGTFILDLIDAKTDQLVWRGIAEGVLEEYPSPEQMDRDVNDMVKRILVGYPPQS